VRLLREAIASRFQLCHSAALNVLRPCRASLESRRSPVLATEIIEREQQPCAIVERSGHAMPRAVRVIVHISS
jgi:hypothetical protein